MNLVNYEGEPHVVISSRDDWGIRVMDLAAPPRRLWADMPVSRPPLRTHVDPVQTTPLPTPAELHLALPEGDNWPAMSRRSLARLEALALLAEDPQRRLEAREVVTLAHQMSLVRHILDTPGLRRVLIADEVGLGKTVEAALILKELLEANPGLRILYLAPAKLVSNVAREFNRMNLSFRSWKAQDSDARMNDDDRIIASLHRAVHPRHFDDVLAAKPWDVIVVDECHHLSDWAAGGGDPVRKLRLVRGLVAAQPETGYLLLLSGTPHQANPNRFENLLNLLLSQNEPREKLSGRVIFRTKEDVRDWNNDPIFPRRQVNPPLVCDISEAHRRWLTDIHSFFLPPAGPLSEPRKRAAGWRCAQALQWATSSPNAGLGYLVRQALRASITLEHEGIRDALAAMRPYRGGSDTEPVEQLFARLQKEIVRQKDDSDIEDIEDEDEPLAIHEARLLTSLIRTGTRLVTDSHQPKWELLWDRVLAPSGEEKVVLFAQPIETVLALAGWLKRRTGTAPAVIIGGQSDAERDQQVANFRNPAGPRFLLSSKAGGEGINLQFSRRLVHLDVPWNPMDMEQRIGRVHRFGSKLPVIVDTMVVRDSRETHTWSTARSRLHTVAKSLVTPERFEALFSRVMCLIPPEELQEVLNAAPQSPISAEEESKLAALVESGYRQWKGFHDRFADNQRRIRALPSGLAKWDDLRAFLIRHADAEPFSGITVSRFRAEGDAVITCESPADVLRFKDRSLGLIGDYSGSPLGGPAAASVNPVGLNVGIVAETIRKCALPAAPAGAALLRWPEDYTADRRPFGTESTLLFFLRQRIRLDTSGGCTDLGMELHAVALSPDGTRRDLSEHDRGVALDLLRRASIRTKPADHFDVASVRSHEAQIIQTLSRPTDSEVRALLRFAVWPILVAHLIPG